jgi:dihydrofolate reductase
MGKVGAGFSMSLDGFITGLQDDVQRLFGWMFSGDTEYKLSRGDRDIVLKAPAKSIELLEDLNSTTGAVVTGRRMFDVAGAWGGRHPLDVPVFVVTHNVPQEWVKEGSPFTFVTDGVESAIRQAREAADNKNVGVGGANIAQQCIRAGLLDEIQIDLLPVLLGAGIRLFDHLGDFPIELESTMMIESPGVTHLRFRVVKDGGNRP